MFQATIIPIRVALADLGSRTQLLNQLLPGRYASDVQLGVRSTLNGQEVHIVALGKTAMQPESVLDAA